MEGLEGDRRSISVDSRGGYAVQPAFLIDIEGKRKGVGVTISDGDGNGLGEVFDITGLEDDPPPHDPEHAELDRWHAVHRTNLDGVFLGCKHAVQAMRRSGGEGSIINISSRSGLVGIPGAAAYASSKAAVRNHTKTVALYCAEQGLNIRCNSIQPAAILTPMWDPILGTGPERGGEVPAGDLDGVLGIAPEGVEARRVARRVGPEWRHRLDDPRIRGRGGVVVEVEAHARILDHGRERGQIPAPDVVPRHVSSAGDARSDVRVNPRTAALHGDPQPPSR